MIHISTLLEQSKKYFSSSFLKSYSYMPIKINYRNCRKNLVKIFFMMGIRTPDLWFWIPSSETPQYHWGQDIGGRGRLAGTADGTLPFHADVIEWWILELGAPEALSSFPSMPQLEHSRLSPIPIRRRYLLKPPRLSITCVSQKSNWLKGASNLTPRSHISRQVHSLIFSYRRAALPWYEA